MGGAAVEPASMMVINRVESVLQGEMGEVEEQAGAPDEVRGVGDVLRRGDLDFWLRFAGPVAVTTALPFRREFQQRGDWISVSLTYSQIPSFRRFGGLFYQGGLCAVA